MTVAARAKGLTKTYGSGDAVVTALDPASMAFEQKAMDLHHPIDALAIGGRTALGQGFAAQSGPDASP